MRSLSRNRSVTFQSQSQLEDQVGEEQEESRRSKESYLLSLVQKTRKDLIQLLSLSRSSMVLEASIQTGSLRSDLVLSQSSCPTLSLGTRVCCFPISFKTRNRKGCLRWTILHLSSRGWSWRSCTREAASSRGKHCWRGEWSWRGKWKRWVNAHMIHEDGLTIAG